MKTICSTSALAFAAAGFISGCASRDPLSPTAAAPAAADSEPHATGLRPPTPAERARMDELAKKNPETVPNALARERLNAERKAQGLPPLPVEPAPPSPAPAPK